jgi:Cu/Ag efflux protein CusF
MFRFILWPLAAMLILPGAALAQAAPSAQALKHDSAFSDYRRYEDQKLATWRDVNDTAGVLGGHAAHLRDVARSVNSAGTILEIDPAQARVRIDGDAVRALGWPAGIAFWPLKSPELARQVKAGERVAFTLEKDGDVYRVVGFDRNAPPAVKPSTPDPHAGHGPGGRK